MNFQVKKWPYQFNANFLICQTIGPWKYKQNRMSKQRKQITSIIINSDRNAQCDKRKFVFFLTEEWRLCCLKSECFIKEPRSHEIPFPYKQGEWASPIHQWADTCTGMYDWLFFQACKGKLMSFYHSSLLTEHNHVSSVTQQNHEIMGR